MSFSQRLRRLAVATVAAPLLVLASCTAAPAPAPAPGGSPGQGATPGGGGERAQAVTLGTTSVPRSANPLEQSWTSYTFVAYDSLLRRGIEPKPKLATAWTMEGTDVTFTLRDDVKFHDGTPLTAEDVAFVLNTTKKEGWAHAQNLASFESATAEGNVVTIKLSRPDALALQQIGSLPIIPKAYWEEKGPTGFLAQPIGSGPYKIVSFSPETGIEFEANTDYWGEVPPTPKVSLRFYKDPQAIEAAFLAGQLHVAHAVAPTSVTAIRSNPDLEVHGGYVGGTTMLQFNTTKPPFNDPNLRRAANLAVDQAAMIKALTLDTSDPEDGQVTYEGVAGHRSDIKARPHDLAEAKRLVAASSYKGEPVTFVSSTMNKPMMEAIGGYLTEAGFTVKIEALDLAVWLEQFRNGSDADVFSRGMSYTGIDDASRAYRWLTHSAKPFVQDPEWLELWGAIGSEQDVAKRTQLLEQATQMVFDRDYVLFTYSTPSPNATRKGVSGIEWLNPAMDFTNVVYEGK